MLQHGIRPGPRPYLAKRREELAQLSFEHIEVVPIEPTIGAEIGGVDLRGPISDAVFDEILCAHHAYRVIFFRGQDLDSDQHLAFARRFGELEEHPFLPAAPDRPNMIRFEKGKDVGGYENIWHSDVSWREIPSLGSVLRAHHVPDVGGDTLFADMVAAYECLDDGLRARIDPLVAVHDFTKSFGLGLAPEELAKKRKEFPAVEHPVVRTHPHTGERALYVNAIFTSHIVGMAREEGDALLQTLFREAAVPEYQCRFSWAKDSVAFWDNRVVQHYASNDYWPRRRVMDRVTIIGERPV